MKRLLILLAIVVVAVGIAFLSLPEDPGTMSAQQATTQESEKSKAEAKRDALQAKIESERDKRLAAMQKEYDKLERERRDLRLRLQEISYHMGQADLSAEQRQTMQDEIGDANRLLINPPLLGAFRGPADITQERDKIARANDKLDRFERIIRENGGYKNAD